MYLQNESKYLFSYLRIRQEGAKLHLWIRLPAKESSKELDKKVHDQSSPLRSVANVWLRNLCQTQQFGIFKCFFSLIALQGKKASTPAPPNLHVWSYSRLRSERTQNIKNEPDVLYACFTNTYWYRIYNALANLFAVTKKLHHKQKLKKCQIFLIK